MDRHHWHLCSTVPAPSSTVHQHMWVELSRGHQLEYLGREGQEKVKGALTVLAAYCALREHPLQTGVDSPQQVKTCPGEKQENA